MDLYFSILPKNAQKKSSSININSPITPAFSSSSTFCIFLPGGWWACSNWLNEYVRLRRALSPESNSTLPLLPLPTHWSEPFWATPRCNLRQVSPFFCLLSGNRRIVSFRGRRKWNHLVKITGLVTDGARTNIHCPSSRLFLLPSTFICLKMSMSWEWPERSVLSALVNQASVLESPLGHVCSWSVSTSS